MTSPSPSQVPSAGSKKKKTKKQVQNGRPKNSNKDGGKPDAKDFRYLETAKMVRHMFPVTINGYAVAKLFENEIRAKESDAESQNQTPTESQNQTPTESRSQTPVDKKEAAGPSGGKKKRIRLSKKMKEDLICKHIKKIIDRDASQAIYLSFMMTPEDPDFPFDIDTLNFNLAVPHDYGRSVKALPSIIVLNTDIPRGFSINVEKGFTHIASLARNPQLTDENISLVGKGLLGQVQTLNKYLDTFLSQEKRQTMKFVSFKSDKKASPAPETSRKQEPLPKPIPSQSLPPVTTAKPIRVSSESQSRRIAETDEMCHKLQGSVKLFHRTAAESRYKVHIPVSSRKGLPVLWKLSDSIDLFVVVPAEYPEAKPRVTTASNFSSNLMVAKKNSLEAQKESLIDVVKEYKRAEANIAANATQRMNPSDTLLQLLNYISNNLGVLTSDKPAFNNWSQAMEELKASA